MKIELKHISGYLPYQVDVEFKRNIYPKSINRQTLTINILSLCENLPLKFSIKPILRPMSDLYKEIDGVVGIVELIHILCGADISDIKNARVVNNGDNYTVSYQSLVYKDVWFSAKLEYNNDSWYFYWEGELISFNQLELFEYLFSHHYDIYSLIDKGLAIDINTLGKEADNG